MTEYVITRSGRTVSLMRVNHNGQNKNGKVFDVEAITPKASQAVYNHSPDGFEFGYGGSGPAQLALAILLDALKAPCVELAAVEHHQEFKEAFIANQKGSYFTIDEEQIARWFADRIGIAND